MTKVVAIADNKAPADKMSYPSDMYSQTTCRRESTGGWVVLSIWGGIKIRILPIYFLGCARPLKSSPVVVATAKRPSPSRALLRSYSDTLVF